MGEPNLSPIGELSRAFGIEEVGIDRLRALAVSIGANMSPVPPVSVSKYDRPPPAVRRTDALVSIVGILIQEPESLVALREHRSISGQHREPMVNMTSVTVDEFDPEAFVDSALAEIASRLS